MKSKGILATKTFNMKRFILLSLLLVSVCDVWAQNELRISRVHLYRDGAALLEYSGVIATRQARFQMSLPPQAMAAGVHVRTDDREKMVNYLVQERTTDQNVPLAGLRELLVANKGYAVTIEAFEGKESIGYEGELLAVSTETDVAYLRTEQTIEIIPISSIKHITGGRAFNLSKTVEQKEMVLSVYMVGDYNELPLTVLMPITDFASDARYLLDFDIENPEMSLDLTVTSPLNLENVDILFYNHAFQEKLLSDFSSQAAFRLAGVSMMKNTRTTYQVLSAEVPLALSDEVDVDAWEPDTKTLSMKSKGKRYLNLTNNSTMDWFSSTLYERKGLSLGILPDPMPNIHKKTTSKMEYGPSPYILTDNARLVKVKKKAVDINGMKYDSYLYEGKIEIRNTGREAGRVRIIKHAVPDSRRNYWFANRFIDLKGKTKQEVTQMEYEVRVEANDVAFYSYRYELLIPSDN